MNSTALAFFLALFGVLLLALGYRRACKTRFWAAGGNIISGFTLLVAAAMLYVISLNLQTYSSLIPQTPIAELSFNKLGSQSYRATLMRLPAGELQVFTLSGDEWQLDARLLEWHDWSNKLGLTRQFRLERVSGHLRDAEKESAPHTYVLSNNPGFDLWQWVVDHPKKQSTIAAAMSTSASLPIADATRYRIEMNETGLLAQAVSNTVK